MTTATVGLEAAGRGLAMMQKKQIACLTGLAPNPFAGSRRRRVRKPGPWCPRRARNAVESWLGRRMRERQGVVSSHLSATVAWHIAAAAAGSDQRLLWPCLGQHRRCGLSQRRSHGRCSLAPSRRGDVPSQGRGPQPGALLRGGGFRLNQHSGDSTPRHLRTGARAVPPGQSSPPPRCSEGRAASCTRGCCRRRLTAPIRCGRKVRGRGAA